MKKIVKERPAPGIILYRPAGYSIDWEDFIPFFRDPEPFEDLKKNRRYRRRLFLFENKEKKWHIKKMSYLISSRIRDKIRGSLFFSSPALDQLEASASVREAGVETVFPFFSLIKRRGMRKEGLFITEYKKEKLLHQIFSSSVVSEDSKVKFFGQGMGDLRKMHLKKITHGDAHAGNILVEEDKLLWSDFDMMKKGSFYLSLRGREYDIYRFLRSAVSPMAENGFWSRRTADKIVSQWNSRYPGFDRIKEKVRRRLFKERGISI